MKPASTANLFLPVALLAGACSGSPDNGNAADPANEAATMAPATPPSMNAATANGRPAALPTNAWVGRWTGPEGLFLDIQPAKDGKPGHYTIVNQDNLDRKADYNGIAEGTTIRFMRDGKDLSIRPGKGADTGFKYLADEQDCLIVIPGREGYCR